MAVGAIRKFLVNIISGLVINKSRRKKVRVILNSPVASYIKFIRHNLGGAQIKKVKTFVGYQARNLLISVNDKYIYKFPLRRNESNELAIREKRLVDAFQKISPIKIPSVEILHYRGKIIRKYECVQGKTMRQITPDDILRHKTQLARTLANFIYVIGQSDPDEIRDLKPSPDAVPGYMYGWCHGDIPDNFMIDENTFDVLYFIDWEDSYFDNFAKIMTAEGRSPGRELMAAVRAEYDKIYFKHHKK